MTYKDMVKALKVITISSACPHPHMDDQELMPRAEWSALKWLKSSNCVLNLGDGMTDTSSWPSVCYFNATRKSPLLMGLGRQLSFYQEFYILYNMCQSYWFWKLIRFVCSYMYVPNNTADRSMLYCIENGLFVCMFV